MSALLDAVLEDLTELSIGLYEFLLPGERRQEFSAWQQQLENISAYTQKIQKRAGQGGHRGLHDVCVFQSRYLNGLLSAAVIPSPEDWERLERWPLLLLPCLARPVDPAALEELLKYYSGSSRALHSAATFAYSNTQQLSELRASFLQLTSPPSSSGTARLFTLPVAKKNQSRAPQAAVLKAPLQRDLSNDTSVRYLLQHELLDALSEYVYCSERGDARASCDSGAASRLYADRTQLLGISAAGGGLIGLMDCCLLCHEALNLRIAKYGALTAEDSTKIQIWAGLISHHLDAPQDQDGVDALISFYRDGKFIPLMQPKEYDILRNFLINDSADALQPRIHIEVVKRPTADIVMLPLHRSQVATVDPGLDSITLEPTQSQSEPTDNMEQSVTMQLDGPAQRATQACEEDVSLRIPQDVNPKLLAVLLHELPQHAEEFSTSVQRLAAGHGSLRDVESAQRTAHTLKGAANTVGVVGISTLAHHIEDILTTYSAMQRVPLGVVATTLLNAADVLAAMTEALLGTGSEPEHAQATLQDILDCANQIDRDGLSTLTPRAPTPSPVAVMRVESALAITGATTNEKISVLLRVPAPVIDDLIRLVGESITTSAQLQERLRQSIRLAKEATQHNEMLQRLVNELEQGVDVHDATFPRVAGKSGLIADTTVLQCENPLLTVTRQLHEAVTDARELSTRTEDHLLICGELLSSQVRNHKESQDTVMRARMVPVKNIVARLQRAVRQTSQSTGKIVNLRVIGADTLLDSNILDIVVDPLMHVLRNAVDHGIETPEQRSAYGKPELGTIELSFARDGDHVRVLCHDDGQGLDYVQIRRVALSKGILAAEDSIGEEELSRLILLPGFTTRADVTQTSGRGIGLDAVYTCMLQMKGAMKITSSAGSGCEVELRVPLTLLSIHALLVQLNSHVMAVSTRGVEKIVHSGAGKILLEEGRLRFNMDGTIFDAYELETLLHLPVDRRWIKHSDRSALMVRDATSRGIVVFIENVLASQELVVKPLGPYLPKIHGIEGATILGNGSIAAVADLPGLLQTARQGDHHDTDTSAPRTHMSAATQDKPLLPRALVVDDSPSARRAVEECVRDLGFEVRSALDGADAMDKINAQLPDLLVVDLEMPRMNGLELTEQLRAITRSRDLPIIMITSHATHKYRNLALAAGVNRYLTKPFCDDELAECIHTLLETAIPISEESL